MTHPLSAAKCSVCGNPLTLLQQARGTLCDRLECTGPAYQKRDRETKRQQQLERRQFAAKTLKSLKREDLLELPVCVVPALRAPSTLIPPERQQRFRDNLDAEIESAKQLQVTKPVESLHPIPSSSESFVAGNACAACRGSCCQYGAEHAFLREDDISRLVNQHQCTFEEFRDVIVSALPEETIEGSCVMHTKQGCALPRDWRGETCNSFHCAGIHEVITAKENRDATRSVAIACSDDTVYEIGLMSSSGTRTLIATTGD